MNGAQRPKWGQAGALARITTLRAPKEGNQAWLLYAASPRLQCISLDEFITHMSWLGDQAQASGGGGTFGAEAMAKDDEDDREDLDAFKGSDDNIS
ncbi:hypothetical protein LR48_Vigan07g145400 [Vigna angularis]|uniref:Uncharacterized protein n=1 Tax=Phaseolus angularis TaxID=3914 RepID=A0A0L9UYW3_PHAAN|nr:hypothetical protein LR48_Vigan07g145300 [Vigna angularis]KOM47750.1 hypothetical protein LR48_Vigan07g145400 [Vigna angularis]